MISAEAGGSFSDRHDLDSAASNRLLQVSDLTRFPDQQEILPVIVSGAGIGGKHHFGSGNRLVHPRLTFGSVLDCGK